MSKDNYFTINDYEGLTLALEGAAGALAVLHCLEDSNGDKPITEYTAPFFGMLSEITKSAADYIRDNEFAITDALEQNARNEQNAREIPEPPVMI